MDVAQIIEERGTSVAEAEFHYLRTYLEPVFFLYRGVHDIEKIIRLNRGILVRFGGVSHVVHSWNDFWMHLLFCSHSFLCVDRHHSFLITVLCHFLTILVFPTVFGSQHPRTNRVPLSGSSWNTEHQTGSFFAVCHREPFFVFTGDSGPAFPVKRNV